MRHEYVVETFDAGHWHIASFHISEPEARDAASSLSAAIRTRVRKLHKDQAVYGF